jgi:MFS transporter, DHA3 family, tetracycline resistance protein
VSTQFDIEQPVADAGGWRVLAPFKFREYRLLIAAVSLSIFAEGMWAVVMALQVIELDNDPASLSLVATCLGAGLVAFVLVGGLAADRISQRAIIIAVETANVIAVSAIAILGLVGALQIWHMAVAAAALGIAAAFFFPAYSAILPRILPAEQLLAANGVEGVVRPVFQRAVGPAVAGLVVGATFPTLGAMVVAVLFAVGLLLLVASRPAMKSPVQQPDQERPHLLRDLRRRRTHVRFHPGVLRRWQRAWRARGVVEAAPASVSDGDDDDVERRLDPTGDRRHHVVVPADGRCDIRHRVHRWRRDGDLGDAASAAGADADAGPGVEPGLLRLACLQPVSFAIVGPLSKVVSMQTIFLVAGIAPVLLAAVAMYAARMRQDELAHPLRG